jgi:8-hydroxy-5-deazaflavin:NADPH oxidoreductase
MLADAFAIERRALLLAGAAIAMSAALPRSARAQPKPKIGFIGAGKVGGTLAKLWTQAGYQVMLSARDLGPVRELAAQLGPNAHVGTPAEAAAWGDVVVVTVPYGALPQIGHDYAAQLKGKVVLDTCNPYIQRDGDMAKEALEKGTGVMDPIYLPGTRLVRAFNSITYIDLGSQAHRAGEPIGIELAADDLRALNVAKRLVSDAGFEPVVVGGLATAKRFDHGAPIYPKTLPASEMRAELGLE